jgi:hypothetical protein
VAQACLYWALFNRNDPKSAWLTKTKVILPSVERAKLDWRSGSSEADLKDEEIQATLIAFEEYFVERLNPRLQRVFEGSGES